MITMTPEARAIASFTAAAAFLVGSASVFGGSPFFVVLAFPFAHGQGGQLVTCGAMLLVLAAAFALAHDAARRVAPGWALHLAQAARGVLVLDLLVVLFILGLVIDNRPIYFAG